MTPYNTDHPSYRQTAAAPAENPEYGQDPAYGGQSLTGGWFAFNDPGYVKGLLLGAGIAYVLANPKVQRAVVKGAVTLWTSVQGGIEEMKEQIQDVKSEMSMKGHDDA